MHKALHPRDDVDRLCVKTKGREEEEEEDLPVLKTVLTHQYNDLKTTLKCAEEYWLQLPEKILTTWGTTERQEPESKNGKKNNSMVVQAIKKQHLTRENMDVANKWKSYERNWISSNSSTKQRHKNQSY